MENISRTYSARFGKHFTRRVFQAVFPKTFKTFFKEPHQFAFLFNSHHTPPYKLSGCFILYGKRLILSIQKKQFILQNITKQIIAVVLDCFAILAERKTRYKIEVENLDKKGETMARRSQYYFKGKNLSRVSPGALKNSAYNRLVQKDFTFFNASRFVLTKPNIVLHLIWQFISIVRII